MFSLPRTGVYMAFSTEAQLKRNVRVVEQGRNALAVTAIYDAAVLLADEKLKIDTQKYIDYTLVPDDATTTFVNKLSRYLTAVNTYEELGSVKRNEEEIGDLEYWQRKYDKCIQQLENGEIDVFLADGTTSVLRSISRFDNTARPDVKPKFGFDKYGRWINNTDLAEQRDNESADSDL